MLDSNDESKIKARRPELGHMLSAGPMHDIFRADEALAVVDTIGAHAAAVNGSTASRIVS